MFGSRSQFSFPSKIKYMNEPQCPRFDVDLFAAGAPSHAASFEAECLHLEIKGSTSCSFYQSAGLQVIAIHTIEEV